MADPTKGLRIEVIEIDADHVARIQTKPGQYEDTPTGWNQAGVDATHINSLLEAYERRQERLSQASGSGKQPTPGLRVGGGSKADNGQVILTTEELEIKMMALNSSDEQVDVDLTYINWLIETDERRREQSAKRAQSPDDLMVDLGNLGGTERKFTELMAALDGGRNQAYEDMVEEFIQTFNHVVIQGIDPLIALYAMSQGLAITLGFALRANLPFSIAQTILTQQMKSATASERMVRVITAPVGRG